MLRRLVIATALLLLPSCQGLAPAADPSIEPTADLTAPERVSLAVARQVLAQRGPVTVSVLGDSTGDSPFDWVTVWAQRLAKRRAVTLHTWNPYADRWEAPRRLSGRGPRVTVRNYSAPGSTAAQVPRLDLAQPERPDLVIYNFGHNNYTEDHGAELKGLSERVADRWGRSPVPVAISQNPSTGTYSQRQAATMRMLRQEVGPELGIPVINVTRAFHRARGPLPRLLMDTTHPNEAGGRVWARTVDRALRPRRD